MMLNDLIPFPRVAKESGSLKAPAGIMLNTRIRAATEERDFRALADIVLKPWLGSRGGARLRVDVVLDGSLRLAFGRPVPPALADQGYALDIGRTARLAARTYAGLCAGLQTLRQILEDAAARGAMPKARIVDWPRVATRGIHVDLAREMEYRPAHLRRVVEHLAYFRMNTLHLYLENKFAFPSAPGVAPKGAMTPTQARELCAYAGLFGITVIPQLATMGHMEHLLHGRYAELRERPGESYNICPTHPGTRPFLAGLIADAAAAFRSPFIHVGYDESHSGECERCRRHGPPEQLLADHLNWLNGEVRRHGARTMIYADKFISREDYPRVDAANGGTSAQARAALDRVSRDILITDWHYTAPYGGTARALVKAGFEVQMASATNLYWHDSIPVHRGHHWIVPTMDEAIAAGATGVFNTNWEYYRGQYLDNYWFFQALVAERGWTDAPHDYVTWGARFSRRFWGTDRDFYTELAGLAEVVRTDRRRAFIDGDPLAIEVPAALNPYWPSWMQIAFDYRETGEYLIAQAAAFRKAAKRNADTLRMLDMPGQIIRYLGVRAEANLAIGRALQAGDRGAALRALRSIKAAALQVRPRLEDGYRAYGGAVVDRKRLAAQLSALDGYRRMIASSSVAGLKRLTVDDLVLGRREQEPGPDLVVRAFRATELQPACPDIRRAAALPAGLALTAAPYVASEQLGDVRPAHAGRDGMLYVSGTIVLPRAGKGELRFGADGPVRVWVNGRPCACEPAATNPAVPGQFAGAACWKKGLNRIVFALNTNGGKAWGVMARCVYGK